MIHHTGGGTDAGMNEYCYNGSADLPGPLCQGVIGKSGTVHLVGWGRANHAGGGDPDVLAAVVNEDYGNYPPKTDKHEGSPGAVDGNAHFVGFELVNDGDGEDPWPEAQIDAAIRAATAVCRFYGWSAKSVIGHREWSSWKSDPAGFDMKDFRTSVAAHLGEGGGTPAPEQPEPEGPPIISLTSLRRAAQHDIPAATGSTSYPVDVRIFEEALASLGYLDSRYVDGSFGTKTREAVVRLQRYLGYTGSDADGIPGKHSMTWLGLKTGHYRTMD
jgi:peptidoglycan hydrolase-like protein with peptidoglycan-binding domain